MKGMGEKEYTMNFLKSFSIESKIKFLGYTVIVFYVAIFMLGRYLDRTAIYNARQNGIDSLSTQAVTILEFHNQRFLAGELTLKEAQDLAEKLLDSIHHCPANGYFILEGGKKFRLIGRTDNEVSEEDIPKITALLKESQITNRPVQGLIHKDGKPEGKIFSAKLFKPWGWIVGTGDWVCDLEVRFLTKTIKKLTFTFPLIFILFFLFVFITKSVIIPLEEITESLKRLAGKSYHKNFKPTNTEIENIGILIEMIDTLKGELDLKVIQITFLNKMLTKQNGELLDFAFVMSHDVQTPLRKIRLLISKIQHDDDTLNLEQNKLMDQIKEHVNFSKTLIEDILELSQFSSRTLKFKLVPLHGCVQEAIKHNDIFLEDIDNKIIIGSLPNACIDNTLITQLFSNLLTNSIKYMHPDRPLEINITAVLEKKTWVITFSDNGRGLGNMSTKHIFRPFRRGNHNVPGKGLGLAICSKIIEKHRGNIWAEKNSNGEGISIKFTLYDQRRPE